MWNGRLMWFWFCIPLMYNDIKHLVIWLSAIHISSLEKSLSRFLVHFLKIDFFPSSFRFTNFPGGSDSKESAYNAGVAAASLQSCPTLCDPINGSPLGSPVPGILPARTLKWGAISFSNAWKWKVKVKSLSHVQLLSTPWTACSLPGSSVHGIFQVRVLEWGAIAFSGITSLPGGIF